MDRAAFSREADEAASHQDFAAGEPDHLAEERFEPVTLAAIRAALEAAGVTFTNGDHPGVKLRKAEQ